MLAVLAACQSGCLLPGCLWGVFESRQRLVGTILSPSHAHPAPLLPFACRLLPSGRGLLESMSDYVLNKLLPKPVASLAAGGPATPAAAPAGTASAAAQQPLLQKQGAASGAASVAPAGAPEEPDDVLTGVEAAEAALPSADPASGLHPHAPGAAAAAAAVTAAAEQAAPQLTDKARAALRAGVNARYSGTVEAGEVQEMHALLGSPHIFKCFTT